MFPEGVSIPEGNDLNLKSEKPMRLEKPGALHLESQLRSPRYVLPNLFISIESFIQASRSAGGNSRGPLGGRYQGRTADALAWEAEEGRGKLR